MGKYTGSPKDVFKKKLIDFIFIVLLTIFALIVIFLIIPQGLADVYQDFKSYFTSADTGEKAALGFFGLF